MGVILEMLKNKYVFIGAVVFVSAVAAIIFEGALNEIFRPLFPNPWSWMGVGLVVLGMIPILANLSFLHVKGWIVISAGVVLIAVGYIIG